MGVTGQARGSSVLAERAPSEGPRSTRAVEDPRARPFGEVASKLGGSIIDSAAHLLSFTIRWGSVPARVQIAFSRYGNTEQEET